MRRSSATVPSLDRKPACPAEVPSPWLLREAVAVKSSVGRCPALRPLNGLSGRLQRQGRRLDRRVAQQEFLLQRIQRQLRFLQPLRHQRLQCPIQRAR